MSKITDLAVCDMPHGVKVNHAGTKVYVSCMHSDELLEIDISTLSIARRVSTGAGHEGHATVPTQGPNLQAECAPTFVSVSADDSRLFAACNGGNTLQVWDAATLKLLKEVPTGKGAYNVEPSPDGRVVIVTNKKDQSVSIFDATTLTELARVPTTKKIVHGVAYSPDSRYAFITAESIGSDPGSVDMIDLSTRTIVATIPVPAQPTGISIWKP